MAKMEGQHKPARSVLERLSWGRPSEAGKDEIVMTADGLAGVIFMCNKKTKRKCLIHGVFGLPETRQDLVEQVVPGMKLFLFEYESRTLFGIFESTSYGAINLEPQAFLGQESSFPAQVYFQEIAKCVPLLEREFKTAIHENYYTPVKFSLDLTVDQVKKLIRLFQQVTLNANGLHSVSQKGYPYAIGVGELPDRDCEEVPTGNWKKGGWSMHDKTKDLDKTTRAVSTAGKNPVHTHDEKISESQSAHALLEIELRNNLLKRISGNSGILSQNFHPSHSTTLMDERASQYVYPLSDSTLNRAEELSIKPQDLMYPVAGQENWSNGLVLPAAFGNYSEQCDLWKDPLRTRIQALSAGNVMGVLPYATGPHDFRVDPLAPRVQGLNFSHAKDSSLMPIGTISEVGPSVLTNNTNTSFSMATLNGNGVGVDLGAAACPKTESFDLKTIYSRAGNYTHYDRVQLDGHLSSANESVSKDQTCPQSSHRTFGDASPIEKMDILSLVSKLPLYAQQGLDVVVNPSSQSMSNEFAERAHPWDGRCFERWDSNSVVPRGSVESEEWKMYKKDYSHDLLRDVKPAPLGYNLDGVQSLLVSEAEKHSGSETLMSNNALSTLYGGLKPQSSDDSELKRIYELVQGLLLRKETEDHIRHDNVGTSLTSKTPVNTNSGEVYPSRGGTDGCEDDNHALALDKADKKQKQSVWSRLSGLNGREVDRNSHVAERIDVEALSFCTSYALRGNRFKPVHYSHLQSNMETVADDVAEDSCVLRNQDTFTVNFKRRRGCNVTSNDQAICTKMPALQGSSQMEKDKRKSSDATAHNLPNSLPKRRKLIRPEIHDASEGQVAEVAKE